MFTRKPGFTMEDSTHSLVEDAVPETGRDSNVEMSPNLPAELSDRPGIVQRNSLQSFTPGHEQESESQDTATFIGSSSASRFSEPGSHTERAGTHERTGQRHSAQTPAVEGFPKSVSSPPSASSGHLPELVDSLKTDLLKGVHNAATDAFLENQRKSDIHEESFDEEHENNKHRLPTYLQPDHKDAVILYYEEDKSDAEIFMNCLRRQAQLNRLYEPVIALYDDISPELGITPVRILELAVQNSTFMFLYMTKAFCEDFWSQYSSEACLMNSLKDSKKRWSVVPIFTVPKNTVSYIPFTLNSFKGIEFYSEDSFRPHTVSSMLENRSQLRLEKQASRNQERRRWIKDEREKLDAERCSKTKDDVDGTNVTSQSQSSTETTNRSSEPPASATIRTDDKSQQNPEDVSKTKDDVDGTDVTSQSKSSTETTNRSSKPSASATRLPDDKSQQNPEDVSKTKDDVVTIDPSPQRLSPQICVESKKEGVHLAVQMTAGLCPKEGKGDNANAQSWSSPPINPPITRLRHVGQPHFARTREEIHRHTEAVSRETFQQAYQQHTSVHPDTVGPVASAQPNQHYQPMYPDLPQSEQLGLRFPLSEYHRQPGHGAHSPQYFHQRGDSHPLQRPDEAKHSSDGLPCGEVRAWHEEKYIPLCPPSEQSAVHIHYLTFNIKNANAVNISNQTDVAEELMDQDQASSEDSETNCKLLHDGPASADIPSYDFNLPPDEFLLQPDSEQEAATPDKDLCEDRLIRTDLAINEERKKTSKKRRFCCFKW